MISSFDILVVSAVHGGVLAGIVLRQRGFAGTIAIKGDEPGLPYERPPLSKHHRADEKEFGLNLIRRPAFCAVLGNPVSGWRRQRRMPKRVIADD